MKGVEPSSHAVRKRYNFLYTTWAKPVTVCSDLGEQNRCDILIRMSFGFFLDNR